MVETKKYLKKVSKIEQASPNHALLPRLKTGYSILNNAYADEILKKIEIAPPHVNVEVVEKPPEKPIVAEKTAMLNKFLKQKYSLKSQLLQQANSMRVCKSDQERKQVSMRINSTFDNLRNLQKTIDHYERTGTLPEEPKTADFFEIPTDEADRKRAICSCRSSISQWKKQIEYYGVEVFRDETHLKYEDWKNAEEHLKRWSKKLNMLLNYAIQNT